MAALLVALYTSFRLPLDTSWTDLFHEGEYLSPHLYFETAHASPLLIHGQMDYWPAQFAATHCPGALLVCTRAINSGFTALAGVLFFLCAMAAAPRHRSRAFAGVIAIILMLAINGTRDTIVNIQQGAPAIRDVWPLTTILFLLLAAGRGGKAGLLLSFLGGLVAGSTMFFAYNRGLANILAVITYIIVTAVAGAGRRKSIAASSGLGIGLALLVGADLDMARTHTANVLYWIMHGEIWAFGVRASLGMLRAFIFYSFAAPLLIGTLWFGWKSWHRQSRSEIVPILAFLAAICALTLMQTMQRYDQVHLSFAIPYLVLLAVVLQSHRPAPTRTAVLRPASLAIYAIGLVLITTDYPLFGGLRGAAAPNLHGLLLGGLPRDIDLVEPDVRSVASLLRLSNPDCTYVLNNAAGLYQLSSRKPCSTVMMPLYASGTAETQIIEDLAKARPPLIVSRSGDWFEVIDGRGLDVRTPKLAAWIAANYPTRFNVGKIELRSRMPGPRRAI
ncbi:hypothetical protein [Sphingomonas montanisoli]|uniref:Glycosyltransferase RgtA/B/C/D-like domain-containing protein n=1 Tax=Sphingomonas montanisoli TaxID=2606412 RepID=A0A5D9CFU8_9SPHN|nr:hypothetical protein [Sphingomonas montanisoli]TZG29031.1 hypothetical protein FYJ91_02515 [Sphingomonas montanisoli]